MHSACYTCFITQFRKKVNSENDIFLVISVIFFKKRKFMTKKYKRAPLKAHAFEN